MEEAERRKGGGGRGGNANEEGVASEEVAFM